MVAINKTIIGGNLTRPPTRRLVDGTGGQVAVVDFAVAINRRWKDRNGEQREAVTYVECVAWAGQAEFICRYFRKGSPIIVEGNLELDTWEKDGERRSRLYVRVERAHFAEAKAAADARDGGAP